MLLFVEPRKKQAKRKKNTIQTTTHRKYWFKFGGCCWMCLSFPHAATEHIGIAGRLSDSFLSKHCQTCFVDDSTTASWIVLAPVSSSSGINSFIWKKHWQRPKLHPQPGPLIQRKSHFLGVCRMKVAAVTMGIVNLWKKFWGGWTLPLIEVIAVKTKG